MARIAARSRDSRRSRSARLSVDGWLVDPGTGALGGGRPRSRFALKSATALRKYAQLLIGRGLRLASVLADTNATAGRTSSSRSAPDEIQLIGSDRFMSPGNEARLARAGPAVSTRRRSNSFQLGGALVVATSREAESESVTGCLDSSLLLDSNSSSKTRARRPSAVVSLWSGCARILVVASLILLSFSERSAFWFAGSSPDFF